MRKEDLLGIMLLLATCFLGACSATQYSTAGNNPISQPPQSANTSQLSITLSDSPPTGVSVLSLEVNIAGALLLPTVGAGVSLLPGGRSVEIKVKKLETESAILSTISAPAGTYKGLQLTLADPALTVSKGSRAERSLRFRLRQDTSNNRLHGANDHAFPSSW